jgi:hypothetical protein
MSPQAQGLLCLVGFLTWFLAGLPLFIRLIQVPELMQQPLWVGKMTSGRKIKDLRLALRDVTLVLPPDISAFMVNSAFCWQKIFVACFRALYPCGFEALLKNFGLPSPVWFRLCRVRLWSEGV